MFELNLQKWNVMQKAVRAQEKSSLRVAFSANWRQIAQEFHFTDIDGAKKWLHLSSDERGVLRQSIAERYGLDLLFDQIDGNRIELAQKSYKEKLAPIKPNDNYLLCRLPSKHLVSQPLPVGASLRLSIEQVLCLLEGIESVLIVENLDIFDELASCVFPLDMERTLVLYRGSGIHSPKAVKTLLNQLGKRLPIVAFVDIDPAGLQIAYSLGATYWIYPKAIDLLLQKRQVNDIDDFEAQYKQMKHLQSLSAANELSLLVLYTHICSLCG